MIDYKIITAAPGFKSPGQRRWYFANQGQETGTSKPKTGNRWSDIIATAREATKLQPHITPEELVVAVSNTVDPPLTPSEEERIRKLVSPERSKRLVELPEKTEKDERTPETLELIESEWARIQQQNKEQEEKKLPNKAVPIEKVKNTQAGTSVDLSLPAFGQPGLYMTGSHISQDKYIHEQFPEIENADYWRAFQQAVQLLISQVEPSRVKEVIDEEYPTVEVDTVLKAAKGFLKKGSKDLFVEGRLYAEQFTDPISVAAAYADLTWQEADEAFLRGFRTDLSNDAKRLIRKM